MLDEFQDALRQREVIVVAVLEFRRVSLWDLVSAFAIMIYANMLEQLCLSEEPSHRIDLSSLHELNYVFIIV